MGKVLITTLPFSGCLFMTIRPMPALFLGHGSPMNVLEDNQYTRCWQQLAEILPRPKAIVAISAHWYTRGTGVTAMEQPRTIHDFGGFPQALYDTQYPAPGSPALAREIAARLAPVPVTLDEASWGFDHGSWGVLIKMYPAADIPVVQLSIDATQPPEWHLEMGKRLAGLREQGILLVASGNVVHNLRMARRQEGETAYPWAESFNQFVKQNLTWRGPTAQHPLAHYLEHEGGALANPTPEHFLPLLYILGAWNGEEPVTLPIEGMEMGSLSMLSVQIGE
jgi:4,5-DOPA dioxygenase extradiol